MKQLRTVQPLPRYVRRKWLRGQSWAYFFEPPTWARKAGCPVQAEALGQSYEGARDKAESVLLPLFDSWRTGGLSDLVPQRALPGTFDWLAKIFKQHRSWNEIDKATQRVYEQGLNLVADHVLKDGCRVGAKQLTSFTRGFVDALYDKLLVVEEHDSGGNTIYRTRRRFANAAMTACRRAWFVGIRAQERVVPSVNPFAKMGLKTRAAGQAHRQTPTATWDELVAFRNKAKELGFTSIATAALAAWEWLQREEHLFGAFEIRHYRPPERPDSVHVVHPKTAEEAWWPLFDAAGRALFPELMDELDTIKESAIAGPIFRRDHKHRRNITPLPWITARGELDYLRSTVKKIVRAAKLRDELSFSSFRHGGFTEGADADLTDAELRAAGRHRSARQLPTYAKRTRKQLVSVATKRRAERTKAAHLSE
ncbi:MAG TPA: hypothetical protein VGG11_05425 [Xanthobacteraceae bacterium]|jgi:hypothetical protein